MTNKPREFWLIKNGDEAIVFEYEPTHGAIKGLSIHVIEAAPMLAKIVRLEAAIKNIDLTLRVPAAEYVPAIQDVFQIIDDTILEPEKETQ